ncbi:tripartite motif-containing protein 54-like [Limosa lapponica baueri]|uniref:Tripartite motif-containing protein 54-like n=1 Tax=Limosa lapponica baueri TaxID=1758121 RepID=A0A2I0SYX9_LIMLA|nr:tripartite motif-containing protein 54-like [Limosa lapponica baueri]
MLGGIRDAGDDIKAVGIWEQGPAVAMEETEKLISELAAAATDTKGMIDTVGMRSLKDIGYRMAELQSRLHHDYSTKLEKLQAISDEAEACGQLYQQMEALLEQHENSVQFLQEDKKKSRKR